MFYIKVHSSACCKKAPEKIDRNSETLYARFSNVFWFIVGNFCECSTNSKMATNGSQFILFATYSTALASIPPALKVTAWPAWPLSHGSEAGVW